MVGPPCPLSNVIIHPPLSSSLLPRPRPTKSLGEIRVDFPLRDAGGRLVEVAFRLRVTCLLKGVQDCRLSESRGLRRTRRLVWRWRRCWWGCDGSRGRSGRGRKGCARVSAYGAGSPLPVPPGSTPGHRFKAGHVCSHGGAYGVLEAGCEDGAFAPILDGHEAGPHGTYTQG